MKKFYDDLDTWSGLALWRPNIRRPEMFAAPGTAEHVVVHLFDDKEVVE
jgi:hypothetical protein